MFRLYLCFGISDSQQRPKALFGSQSEKRFPESSPDQFYEGGGKGPILGRRGGTYQLSHQYSTSSQPATHTTTGKTVSRFVKLIFWAEFELVYSGYLSDLYFWY